MDYHTLFSTVRLGLRNRTTIPANLTSKHDNYMAILDIDFLTTRTWNSHLKNDHKIITTPHSYAKRHGITSHAAAQSNPASRGTLR
jgi:hypothetical protein